jgi:hypothetical protein
MNGEGDMGIFISVATILLGIGLIFISWRTRRDLKKTIINLEDKNED